MERIGIYGGTFNPPHIGHMRAAQTAFDSLKLDRLLVIPDAIAPHKTLPDNTPSPEQRLKMLQLAAEDCPGLEVSDLEICREGVSYTYETVEHLQARYPGAELVLLMGSDMFLSFETWKESDWLLRETTLGVFCRGDRGERKAMEEQKQMLTARGAKICFVETEICPISSTQLRRLLAFGAGRDFLTDSVWQFIHERGLYDVNANWKNLPMEQLEPVVISLMKPKRVRHILGVRDTATALAERWGADVTDAARAGILHDVTKALDGPLQLTLCSAYGKMLDEFSRKNPKTLHAFTGALVAREIFGENEAVCASIESHTTGKRDMNLLETILYVADYMEPNRDFPGVEKLRRLAFTDIRGALKLGMEMTLEHLREQGSEISPETQDALTWLNVQ